MEYKTEDGHPLNYNPFKAIVAPRPIAWISTRSKDNIANIGPYSFFQGMQDTPPVIGFGSAHQKPDGTSPKDTIANIRETQEFCCEYRPNGTD